MKVIDEKKIDEQAEKFFDDIGKRDDRVLGYHQLNCLIRLSQMLETRSMLNCFLSVLLMSYEEILTSEDEILNFFGYADLEEFNSDIFKTDKYIIERIESTKNIFQSYLYYYTFFVKTIKLKIK